MHEVRLDPDPGIVREGAAISSAVKMQPPRYTIFWEDGNQLPLPQDHLNQTFGGKGPTSQKAQTSLLNSGSQEKGGESMDALLIVL
jgi:hypothetical protein